MVVGQRIESLLAEKGWSQAELARRVGVSQQTIWKLISGHSQGSKHIYAIARELGTSPEYLLNETGNPSIPADAESLRVLASASIPAGNNLVEVREIDLTFGMGATYLEVPVTTSVRQFDRDWLRQYTRSDPENLFCAQGIGDSMVPTLLDHDLLFIDTAQKDLRLGDKIWAIAFGNTGMVKRLRSMPDGSVQILSDNPVVPTATAYDGEMSIIGRVVASLRRQ